MMTNLSGFIVIILLLAACKDEVRNNDVNVASSYSGDNLELQFNDQPLEGKTVKLESENWEKVAVSLAVLLPGEEVTVIGGVMSRAKNGAVSIRGEDVTADRKVSMAGEIREEKMQLSIHVEIFSKIIGKWKLPLGNDDSGIPQNDYSPYIDFLNDAVDTVRLPVFLYNGNVDENRDPIYDYPLIVPMRDTVDKYGRPENGFAIYVMNLEQTIRYSHLLKEIEFMANGNVKVTYFIGPSDTETLEGRIRYGVVNDRLWMVSDSPAMPEIGIPFQLKITPSLAKISITKELLDSFTILSSHIQKLINYQNSKNMIKPGKTTEESVRQFVEVEMVNLIRSSERFECGINLIPVL